MQAEKEMIKSFFKVDGVSKMWAAPEKWTERQKDYQIVVSIKENEHWTKNCCIFHDYFFDYDKCRAEKWEVDCWEYGVFVFSKLPTKLDKATAP